MSVARFLQWLPLFSYWCNRDDKVTHFLQVRVCSASFAAEIRTCDVSVFRFEKESRSNLAASFVIYFDDRHTKLAALGEGKEFNLFFFHTKNRASFLIREACHELKRGNNLQLFSLVCQTGEWMKNICALGSRDLFTFLAALFSFRTAIESARLEREMSRAVLFWSITIEKCL